MLISSSSSQLTAAADIRFARRSASSCVSSTCGIAAFASSMICAFASSSRFTRLTFGARMGLFAPPLPRLMERAAGFCSSSRAVEPSVKALFACAKPESIAFFMSASGTFCPCSSFFIRYSIAASISRFSASYRSSVSMISSRNTSTCSMSYPIKARVNMWFTISSMRMRVSLLPTDCIRIYSCVYFGKKWHTNALMCQ